MRAPRFFMFINDLEGIKMQNKVQVAVIVIMVMFALLIGGTILMGALK